MMMPIARLDLACAVAAIGEAALPDRPADRVSSKRLTASPAKAMVGGAIQPQHPVGAVLHLMQSIAYCIRLDSANLTNRR